MSALRCSQCGASGGVAPDLAEPVDGIESLVRAPCLTCNHTVLLRYLPETGGYELAPTSPGPARAARAVRFGPPLLLLAAGWLVLAIWQSFVLPYQGQVHSVTLGILLGLVAVGLAALGRGYAGAALAIAAGALLIAKPFAHPLGSGASLTSERAMNYNATGALLVLGGGIMLASIRGTLAGRRLRPSLLSVGALVLGLALGAWTFSQETRADVWARHKNELNTWTERLRTVALAIDDAHVQAPKLAGSIAGLDPKPTFESAEVIPVDKLRDPLKVGSPDHVGNGPVRRCLEAQTYDYRGGEWTESGYDEPFQGLSKLRYVVAYEFPQRGRIVVWISDAEGKLLARLTAPHDPSEEPWRVCDVLVDKLVFPDRRRR